MSLKADLHKLVSDAHDLLHDAEEVAVSERNRVADALKAALSAIESAILPDKKPVKKS